MVSKIRAHITNAKSTFTGLQILWMLIWRLVKNINLSRKHTQVFRARNQMLSIDKKNNQFFRISLIQYLSKWALGISFRSVAPWISGEETLQRPMLCIRFFLSTGRRTSQQNFTDPPTLSKHRLPCLSAIAFLKL